MTPLDKLNAAPPAVRAAALQLLDEVASPIAPGELERTFQNEGFTRSQARRIIGALKRLHLVAVPR